MVNIQDDINKVIKYAKSLQCSVEFSPYYFECGSYYPLISTIAIGYTKKEEQLIALLHELGHHIDFKFRNCYLKTIEAEFQAWYHAGELLRLLFNGMYAYFFEKYYAEWLGSYLRCFNSGEYVRGQLRALPSKLATKR